MKNNGFTLAEVLVSISIVGVIAALTLPALKLSTVEAQIGPKLAKAVSTFEQANEALLSSKSVDTLSDAGYTSNTGTYIADLGNYLKLRAAGNASFITKDNMSFTISITESNPSSGGPAYKQRIGDLAINIDNRTAIDDTNNFHFSLWNDGSLRPKGAINWAEGALDADKKTSDADGGSAHWKSNCNIGEAPSTPGFCAGHIFENNLKVLYK